MSCCGMTSKRRFLAVDPDTGDCLVLDEHGGCRRFLTPDGARQAGAEFHDHPGVRRVPA